MTRLRNFIFGGLLAFCCSGCNDTYHSSIPDYPVYLQINLNTAPYNVLRSSPLKYFTFEKAVTVNDYIGYGGIIVCTGFDGTISAFDMACPYEAKNTVKVHPPADKGDYIGQVVCDKCGTVFDLGYGIGNPVKGPAKQALRRYKTAVSGDYLYVTR